MITLGTTLHLQDSMKQLTEILFLVERHPKRRRYSLAAAAAVLSLAKLAVVEVGKAAALAKVAREAAAAVSVIVAAKVGNRAGLAALQLPDISSLEARGA